jgi:Arc/MetJ family transcription regulator
MVMATNLNIDQDLLDTAKKLGRFKTKKETVNKALEEFIRRQKVNEVIDLFGTVVYEEEYDYKMMRER